jgi:hypothetical protein
MNILIKRMMNIGLEFFFKDYQNKGLGTKIMNYYFNKKILN